MVTDGCCAKREFRAPVEWGTTYKVKLAAVLFVRNPVSLSPTTTLPGGEAQHFPFSLSRCLRHLNLSIRSVRWLQVDAVSIFFCRA